MRGFLLDVNALIALLWAKHEHHQAAQHWFHGVSSEGWATCSLTQLGFVRIVSNPAFSTQAVRPAQAMAVLGANLNHPNHEQWEDPWGAAEVLEPLAELLSGYRQVTDAYLLGLAAKYGGRLATFDRGLETLASRRGQLSQLVERIPVNS